MSAEAAKTNINERKEKSLKKGVKHVQTIIKVNESVNYLL